MTTDAAAPDQSLRPYRAGFVFSFFNAFGFMVALGTPLILLAENLGASASQVGLLYSFVFLLLPVQVLATITLPRLGYKKQVLYSWGARTACLLVPLGIAILAPEGSRPGLVTLLMIAMFAFAFFRAIGTCAIQPWLFDLLPDNLQNKYFGTDMMVVGFSGILILVFSGLTFSYIDGYLAFSIQYTVAFVACVLALVALSRLPDVPSPEPFRALRLFTDAPRILRERGDFRRYLLITIVWHTTGSAVVPFGAYFLRSELALGRDVILLFTAMASVGGISGAWFFRSRIARIGVRNAFMIVVGLHVAVFAIWLGFISGYHFFEQTYGLWIFGLVTAYFLLGVSGSCYLVSHLRFLSYISAGKDRALRVSLQTSITGFLTGLASIGWGYLFKQTDGAVGMNVNAFLIYFAAIIIIETSLLPFLARLKEPEGEFKLMFNPRGVTRPFRFLTTMPVFRFLPHEKHSDEDRGNGKNEINH